MNIGKKLKDAREKSKLSQELVSEKLNITRQTLSNWENNKSYPDILNVIELSKIYNITLDYLIKDDYDMINYLKDTTDIVKARYKLSKQLIIGLYLIIWFLSIICFWIFFSKSEGIDISGYNLVILLVLMPFLSFIISFMIGKENWLTYKVLMPIGLGLMYMILIYTTYWINYYLIYKSFAFFSLENLFYFKYILLLSFIIVVLSYIGVFLGIIYLKIKNKILSKK